MFVNCHTFLIDTHVGVMIYGGYFVEHHMPRGNAVLLMLIPQHYGPELSMAYSPLSEHDKSAFFHLNIFFGRGLNFTGEPDNIRDLTRSEE